ncbi:MAG TPA: hypothetical protein VFJ19_16130 [Nocardioidaceae bacterium]|nr:hypothetical protein [Nocardioidaceae bacterium]
MSTETTPPGDFFDRLTEAMPKIAEAVNAFTLQDNQRVALQVLLAAAGVPAGPPAAPETPAPLTMVPPLLSSDASTEEEPDGAPQVAADEPDAGAAKPKRVRKPVVKKTYPRVKDINFRPEGKASLRDFWAQKEPSNNHEKNLVIVYYLEEFLEVAAIEVGHVLAGYDEVGKKSPAIPDNSLMVTASQKRWLDTSDMKAVRTTHGGRNTIQYDMPIKKDKKSA